MKIKVKPRAEEILILAAIGAGVGLAVTSPITAGASTYLPTHAATWLDSFRGLLAWASVLGGAAASGWLATRQDRDTHLRGAQYIDDPVEARLMLQGRERKQFSERQKKGEVHGIDIAGIELARSRETSHLYAVGLTGGGKTVLLQSIIDQTLARGDRLIVHDIKGDLAARYFDPATCVMMGPWDERAAIWDAAADIDSPAQADEFAAGATGAHEVKGKDAFWYESAAKVLSGLIRSYMRDGRVWTWADIRNALAGDPIALIQQANRGEPLVRSQFATVFPKPDSKIPPYINDTGASILSTLVSRAGWILSYAAVDAKDPDRVRFSLTRWIKGTAHGNVRVVFLNYNKVYRVAAERIFGALIASLSATVASGLPEVGADGSAATWCIFDEFPQMGAGVVAESQAIAELGRSRGVRLVMALQDEAQLAALLGAEKAAPILAQQVTRIYMRTSPQTVEKVCRRIGQRQMDRIESTAQNGAIAGKTKKPVIEQVLMPDALLGLQVRTTEPPLGVEMVVHIDDLLGKVIQPFPERREAIASDFVESQTWKLGSLPDDDDTPAPAPQVEAAASGGDAKPSDGDATPSDGDTADDDITPPVLE